MDNTRITIALEQRERAALIGGVLNVTSQPGAGTVVQLTIEDFIK